MIKDALVKVCIMSLFMSKFCYIEMPVIGKKYGLLLHKIHVNFYYIYIYICLSIQKLWLQEHGSWYTMTGWLLLPSHPSLRGN